jgi:hypothetical protein
MHLICRVQQVLRSLDRSTLWLAVAAETIRRHGGDVGFENYCILAPDLFEVAPAISSTSDEATAVTGNSGAALLLQQMASAALASLSAATTEDVAGM